MRLARYQAGATGEGLAVAAPDGYRGLADRHARYPGPLEALLEDEARLRAAAELLATHGAPVDLESVTLLPPMARCGKIICIGLNYRAHAGEAGFEAPTYPAVFARFTTSLIGHRMPILRPTDSTSLDYEGELVAIVGRAGRRIARDAALGHVAGYAVGNDGSVRDFQFRSSQWTAGKNFDRSGALGPALVTSDELPGGCRGCSLKTRVNGKLVQSASISDLIFDVAALVELLSTFMTLEPGDAIFTGTPAGVGYAAKPPAFLQPGDCCEVEIDGVGTLTNPIAAEVAA